MLRHPHLNSLSEGEEEVLPAGSHDARKRGGPAPAKAGAENIIDADPSAEALGYSHFVRFADDRVRRFGGTFSTQKCRDVTSRHFALT